MLISILHSGIGEWRPGNGISVAKRFTLISGDTKVV